MLFQRNFCSSCVALVTVLVFIKGYRAMEMADQVFTELFENRHYNRLTEPIAVSGQTIHVQHGLVFQKIVEVDEMEEVFRANLWHRFAWSDYRLAWNATEYRGLDRLTVPASTIWLPDITLWNDAKDEKNNGLDQELIRVNSDGSLRWYTKMELSVTHCPMNILWFPFDDQRCPLIYESWKYESRNLNLSSMTPSVDLNYYQRSGEWTMMGIDVEASLTKYFCCDSPFNRLTYHVRMRRKPLNFFFNLVIPCCLFSIISIITFILPPASGERVGVGLTLLLALSVYQMMVSEKLPKTSDAVPILGVYFMFVMFICSFSVVITMVTLSIYYHQSPYHCSQLPDWAKRHVCGRLATWLRLTNASEYSRSTPTMKPYKKVETDDSHVNNVTSDADATELDYTRDKPPSNVTDNATVGLLNSVRGMIETRLMVDKKEREKANAEEDAQKDWVFAAMVIDRLCFIVFGLLLFVGTTILFLVGISSRWVGQ